MKLNELVDLILEQKKKLFLNLEILSLLKLEQ
jgi:hypothetical protein